jgi:hypothetical protein
LPFVRANDNRTSEGTGKILRDVALAATQVTRSWDIEGDLGRGGKRAKGLIDDRSLTRIIGGG